MDCKYVVYYVNLFLLKKKCISSGVVPISICCGIWEGENHLIDQIKTLYAKSTSRKLPEQKYLCPCPALACPAHCESELHQKSQVWVMTLSAADHRNCLGTNRLSLIDQPCHLIAEFAGTETLWLCCCPT